MKNLLIMSITLLILALEGCVTQSASVDTGYFQYCNSIIEKVKNTPDYRRIPIDTKQQEDSFMELQYKAYKKEISREEFIRKMEREYPGYSESIKWVADQLPN